jgi:hypothetical protein
MGYNKISRRKLLEEAVAATSISALAGCSTENTKWDPFIPDSDNGSGQLDKEDSDTKNQYTTDEISEPRETETPESDFDTPEPLQGACNTGNSNTRFMVSRGERVFFTENPEVTAKHSLEGAITGLEKGVRIDYLNQIKHIDIYGDDDLWIEDNYGDDAEECFLYSGTSLDDIGEIGEVHARCFQVKDEHEDSYVMETGLVIDEVAPDRSVEVPICIYREDY